MVRTMQTASMTVKHPMAKEKVGGRQKKHSNAPKRPMPAYFHWLAENLPIITKSGVKPGAAREESGKMWRKVEDKSKWEKMAADDKQRYADEMEKYKAGGESS